MEGRREERWNRAIKRARGIGGEVGVGDRDPGRRGDVTNPQFPLQEKVENIYIYKICVLRSYFSFAT
jgi:hypothetical protein